eukprot:4201920-Pleurochrysis_carterae.AAC.1
MDHVVACLLPGHFLTCIPPCATRAILSVICSLCSIMRIDHVQTAGGIQVTQNASLYVDACTFLECESVADTLAVSDNWSIFIYSNGPKYSFLAPSCEHTNYCTPLTRDLITFDMHCCMNPWLDIGFLPEKPAASLVASCLQYGGAVSAKMSSTAAFFNCAFTRCTCRVANSDSVKSTAVPLLSLMSLAFYVVVFTALCKAQWLSYSCQYKLMLFTDLLVDCSDVRTPCRLPPLTPTPLFVTISRLIFSEFADTGGGAVEIDDNAMVELSHCEFVSCVTSASALESVRSATLEHLCIVPPPDLRDRGSK